MRIVRVPAAAVFAAMILLNACARSPQEREAKYLDRGKKEFAAREYKKALVDFKVASQNMPKDAEPVYQLGMVYLTVGAARQAIESFTKAVSLDPKHEGAQYEMALVKVGSNKPDIVGEARQVLEAYTAKHSDNAEALGALALAQAKLGEKDTALKTLYAAAAKNPSGLRAEGAVIALYAARGDVDTAKTIARELAEKLPNSPDAAVLRAQVSLATKDNDDADAQIKRALQLKRDFQPALELQLRRELMTQNGAAAEATTQELAKLPQERSWGAYARMLLAERKVDQGIAEYNRVLKEHTDSVPIRNEYSAALMRLRKNQDAEAIVNGTLAKTPKDRTALMQRTTLELDRGDIDGGAKDIKTLQELKAFSPQLSYEESRVFGARGEINKEGDRLAEALKANPRYFVARLELGRVLTEAGNPKVALETLDAATPAEKNTGQWIFYHNTALMAAGDWLQARKGVDTALKVVRSPGFLYQDAILRLHDKDMDGARKSLNASFQIAPADHLTLNLLGSVMRAQKEGPQFTALLKDAAAKNPKSPVLQSALGAQLESSGDVNGARAAFEAQKAAGDPVTAENDLALLDMRTGKLDDARKRLLELIKTHDNAPSRLLLAEIETRKGSGAEIVVKHYLRAIDMAPQNVAAMNNLADVLATKQQKYDDAMFWAQKALGLAPNSPAVADTLGWIYYRQKKYDAALPYLEKSAKGQDRPLAHYHLAGVLANEGDWTRAKKEYELAMKEDPKSAARSQVQALFEGRK